MTTRRDHWQALYCCLIIPHADDNSLAAPEQSENDKSLVFLRLG
jgi:hypothetical protein